MQDDSSVSAPAELSMPARDAMSGGISGLHPSGVAPAAPSNGAEKPKSSGYARLKTRHSKLIAEHEALKGDFAALADMYQKMEITLLENTELLEQTARRNPPQPPQWRPEPMAGLQSLFARGVR
jgi:hypothetical protein